MAATADDEHSTPWGLWGVIACAVVCAVLFVTSTSPALAEQSELQEVRASLQDDLLELRKLLRDFRSRGLSSDVGAVPEDDLQGLLVAIDALGHTPAELLALFPEEPSEDPEGLR